MHAKIPAVISRAESGEKKSPHHSIPSATNSSGHLVAAGADPDVSQRLQKTTTNSSRTQQLGSRQMKYVSSGNRLNTQNRDTEQLPTSNNDALPPNLKKGIENLSGMSMDNVKVHYNSPHPARVNAHAFAQGTDIYLGPGQEKHLPHEAWHVVQQAQGRVAQTMQAKDGMPGNDDRGLEQEADVMGAHADDAGRAGGSTDAGAQVGPHHLSQAIASANGPRQLKVDIITADDKGGESRYDAVVKDRDRKNGILDNIEWVIFATDIYTLIDSVRSSVKNEVDVDVVELEEVEERADKLVTKGNAAVKRFNEAENFHDGEILRPLIATREKLTDLLYEVNETYSLSEGGFNAKGRATEIEDVDISTGLSGRNNAFIDNITLNGLALNTRHSVTKPETTNTPGPQRLRVNGVVVANPRLFTRKLTKRNELEKKLGDAPKKRTKYVSDHFSKAERRGGQEKHMNDTNARGYAWITDTPGWNTTRWEWLHVQGAALSGATDSTNLVLGTRDSNTHMMPFESNLKSLAALVKADNRYEDLKVTWSVEGRKAFNHRWDIIRIKWDLNKKDGEKDDLPEPYGDAAFSPLETGSVLSKTEVAHLEEALKEAREDKAGASAGRPSRGAGKGSKKKGAAAGGGEKKHTKKSTRHGKPHGKDEQAEKKAAAVDNRETRTSPVLVFDEGLSKLADYDDDEVENSPVSGSGASRRAASMKRGKKAPTKGAGKTNTANGSGSPPAPRRKKATSASQITKDSKDEAPASPNAMRGVKRKNRQTAEVDESAVDESVGGPARRTRAKTVK